MVRRVLFLAAVLCFVTVSCRSSPKTQELKEPPGFVYLMNLGANPLADPQVRILYECVAGFFSKNNRWPKSAEELMVFSTSNGESVDWSKYRDIKLVYKGNDIEVYFKGDYNSTLGFHLSHP